jgi:hypothetical protein
MFVNWSNYKEVLPIARHDDFQRLANKKNAGAIIYTAGVLRYASIDELDARNQLSLF